jgi:exosortase/archaeosortase family protein
MQDIKIPSSTMALAVNRHKLTAALKFSVITLIVIALYFQDLSLVFKGALTDESTFHILAIPFIFGYLLYRKRKMVNASLYTPENKKQGFQRYLSSLAGISLFAVAILTYWYGSYTFIPLEYHMLTLPFLTAGLILLLFNAQTLKQLIFPVAFLIFLTPPPAEILYGLGSALANVSAIASNSLANVFGFHAALSSSTVGPVITLTKPNLTTLPFNISVACSGIYSLIGFTIFAIFVAYITPGKLRNKLIILVLGVPLILVLNIIRITTILGIGYNYGIDLALQVFHSVGATVLMFVGTLLLLAVSEKVFKKPKPTPPCPTCNPTPKSPVMPFCKDCGKLFRYTKTKLTKGDIAKIASVAIITVMLLSIQAPVFALTQGPPEVIAQTPSGTHVNPSNTSLPAVAGYNLRYAYRDTQYEQISGNDAAIVYSYDPTDETANSVSVAIQIASSPTLQHRWETCLVNFPLSQGDEATVTQLDLRDIQLQENPPMTARYFAFQYKADNQSQVVLYWYETATFDTNGTAQTKSVMMSLIMYPKDGQSIQECENQELPIAQAINNYWQPIKTWTTVSLAISQNGLALSTGASAIFLIIILYAFYLNRKEKLSLLTLYGKLSTQDQLLIKAIDNIDNKNSTQAIASEFQKLSSTSTSEAYVSQKLEEAEKTGLIKKIIKNNRDTPVLVWKTELPKRTSFFAWLRL